ncbi:MAG: C4-dicarboxylate ABC transporter substrate-binding protein [Rubrivivax sp.]|nr:C4-dicarboxylate ABC transporter substrate-binding protein [Rubrivivax sp.]
MAGSVPSAPGLLRYRAGMDLTDPRRPRAGRWLNTLARAGPPVVVTLLLLVSGMLWLAYRWLDPTPEKTLVLATGPDQGAHQEFGKRYLPLLQADGLTVTLRETEGSLQNLALLRDRDSGVQAAFVQSGVEQDAPGTPADPLVSLGSVAYEPLWLFYREDSARKHLGHAPLLRLSQLAGWHVGTGPPGGGAGLLFAQLARANGLDPSQISQGDVTAVATVVRLVQGQADALLLVAAPDAPLVQYLLRTPGVRLFEFQQAEAYARRFPFLRAVTLPRGVIDLAADQPPADVQLLATTASLVARADLHPALMQLLVQAAQQVHGKAGWFQHDGELPSPAASGFELAPEAERFYRNGKPWLQRYLPFWLANFVDRMWIVLLPLLAAAVPLSRVLPPLVELRLRSRIFRWYEHLRALEANLEQPGADPAALRSQLEHIDTQVERIGVPLSYANELYQLRSHIHLVRKRLQSAAGGR